MTKSEAFKWTIVVGLVAVVFGIIIGFSSLTEFIDNDEYAIHQSAIKGKLTVWNTPGLHWQLFGKVVKYKKAVDIYLSSDPLDGGEGAEVQAVTVLFPDGQADVDVVARYKLSLNEEDQKELYINYGGPEAIKSMVRQQVLEAVKQVGPLMSSAEAYSDRKPEFAILAKNQALEGVYLSKIDVDTTKDNDDNLVFVKKYNVKLKNGRPIITKESILGQYNITLPQFNVKDMRFDSKTVALINARKEAQKARQDAITAYQEGQAKIAKEKATQEVEKIKQVTIAEKEKAVAVLDAERKKEVAALAAKEAAEKKKEKVLLAQAKKAELEIADGLSERAQYEIDKRTEATIESAKYFSKWVGPQIVVTGSGGKGGSGLGDVLMLERYMEINAKNAKNMIQK